MRWLLDSNVLIDALARVAAWAACFARGSGTVRGFGHLFVYHRIEVLGIPNLSAKEEDAIRRLLNEFEEVAVSNAVIERTIQIRKLVRIKIPDALIAASADTAQAVVVTRNTGDFQRVPGLTVLHPDNV